jgi:transposase-like protein
MKQCPWCNGDSRKKGFISGRQRLICRSCNRVFVENPVKGVHSERKVYSAETKACCLWMARSGESYPEITKATGVPAERVHIWIRKAGIEYPLQSRPQRPSGTIQYKNGRKFYSERVRRRCIELWEGGHSYSQIAEKMRVNSVSTVKDWIYKHNGYKKKPEGAE